jgi:hypothetical protein
VIQDNLTVVLRDVGGDAVLHEPPGDTPILYLRPAQSRESAIAAVLGCLPSMHPDAAARLVDDAFPSGAVLTGTAIPDTPAELLHVDTAEIPDAADEQPTGPIPMVRRRRWPRLLTAAGAVAAVLVVLTAMTLATMPPAADTPAGQSPPSTLPNPPGGDAATEDPATNAVVGTPTDGSDDPAGSGGAGSEPTGPGPASAEETQQQAGGGGAAAPAATPTPTPTPTGLVEGLTGTLDDLLGDTQG